MKDLKLGKKTYKVMTDISEFPNIRKTLLRQYQRQVSEKVDNDIFEPYFKRIVERYNKSNFMDALFEVLNYRSAINIGKLDFDAFDMMFSLICLEDGEDKFSIDEDFLKDKVKRMNKDGLTTKQVYDNVVFFCNSCLEIFQDFLNTLPVM